MNVLFAVGGAQKSGKIMYFGKVFPLCHVKHSQMSPEHHVHKGRVVFGGHNVRDEHGALAVFQEHGASASHMVSTKIQDACARLPGNDGQDADAYKAYLQALMADHEGDTETWIKLPEDRWPKHWHGKFCLPMVRLLRNL